MNAGIFGTNPALLESEFDRVTIDSRETEAGDVFFALSQPDYKNNCFNGDFEDSTKYVASAFEKGAAAAVVRPDRYEEHKEILEPFRDKLLFVDDAIFALQLLAKGVYEEWNKPVVGITGSAGKTTAREITSHILRVGGESVLSNVKNYNNNIGHPLTVLRLLREKNHDVAVLEMGMSTPQNEIARLCRITPPTVAIELNVLPVHIEHLGSIEGIQKAKAELVEGMKPNGTAVLNADDFRVFAMRDLHKGKNLTYGIETQSDVMAKNIRFDKFGETVFTLQMPGDEAEVLFPLNGRHNIMNALAAAAVGYSFGMSAREIAAGLHTVAPPPQRGEILHFAAGFMVVNDSYNSNPDALVSMAQTIVDGGGRAKRKIVVAGEMLELGADAEKYHYETGAKLARVGIEALFGVRNLARELVRGASENGLTESEFFEDSEQAGDFLTSEIREGDLVLIKGSRGVRTEKVVEKLLEKFELEKSETAKR